MLFVTNNDTVYGLGANSYGYLGFGHDMDVKTPLIIRELCGQRIQQFITGYDFVLAMNEDNHVFSWGHNDRGQCARDVTPIGVYLKPQLISQLNDKNIAYFCCGAWHSLAITTDGKAYGWGYNIWGQIGSEWQRIVTKLGHNWHENHYKSLFIELSAIGSGDFSEEYLQRVYNEVKTLGKLSPEYCVQYYNSWPEDKHLYIKMEFCSQNLRNILEVKPQVFGRQLGEAMDCVENGRFVKLCDFGMAVEHLLANESHSKGAIPKRMSSSISRNTESNVSTGYISSIREKFEKLFQNRKTEK
ncbi:unnamed protein product [Oppiella nova]|uniref:Uncharacterized protein n=1 Tax=Oppiella nova TaxID=334625 RepID=A0A7R9M2P6_9ACAR|nr:unnamed protein product [Oppiella nova]CAG2168750.1 unnamed protein product [Oppiella nova]